MLERVVFICALNVLLLAPLYPQEKSPVHQESKPENPSAEVEQQPIKGEIKDEKPQPPQDEPSKEVSPQQKKPTTTAKRSPVLKKRKESPPLKHQPDVPNIFNLVLPLLIVFGLLIGAMFLLKKFFKNSPFLTKEGILKLVAYKKIAKNKELFLVRLGRRVYFIGATKEKLGLLGIISRPEEVALIDPSAFKETLKEQTKTPPSEEQNQQEIEDIKDELDDIWKKLDRFKDVI
jgi:flagellar biogenesis protein FliO